MDHSMSYRDKSLITVLLPVADDKYLEATLKSIEEQSLPDELFDLLVVNDGMSGDLINKVVNRAYSKLNVKIIDSDKHGIVGALNTGLVHCNTKYIARIDQDDLMLKDRLKIQLEYLEANKQVLCVGGQLQLIDDKDNSIGFSYYPKSSWLIKKSSYLSSPMAHPAVMFRRNSVMSIGGYREGIPEDWDLWMRLLETGRIENLDKVIIKYRIHGNQLSRTKMYQSNSARRLIRISANLRIIGAKDCPEAGEEPEIWMQRNILLGQANSDSWKLLLWQVIRMLNSKKLKLIYQIKKDYK